jgi:hypothetical protein
MGIGGFRTPKTRQIKKVVKKSLLCHAPDKRCMALGVVLAIALTMKRFLHLMAVFCSPVYIFLPICTLVHTFRHASPTAPQALRGANRCQVMGS